MECIPVDAFYAIETSFTSTMVTWSGGTPAMEYVVNYRMLGDTAWYAVSVFEDSIASLYALDTCTGYEFNITSKCDELLEATTESDTFYTLCDSAETSIYDPGLHAGLIVYPNPSNGLINIRFDEPVYGELFIMIRNSTGSLSESRKYFIQGGQMLTNLQISNDITGTNYITIIYDDNIITRTLITTR